MCMLFVGGYTTMWGTLISAPMLWGVPLLFPSSIASWRMVLFGFLLIIVLSLRPEGLLDKKMVNRLGKGFFLRARKNN